MSNSYNEVSRTILTILTNPIIPIKGNNTSSLIRIISLGSVHPPAI